MKLIDVDNIDFVILEDSLNCITHNKGDEVDCVIGASEVKAIIIPEGATNGDMIKAMFPNLQIIENRFVMEWRENGEFLTTFDGKDWWNAPYKTEREDV